MSMIQSSIGRKWIVAITGILMIGFIFVHMTGNLQMFAGTPDKINLYAHLLHSYPLVLWGFRLGLLARFRDAVHQVADFSKIEG